MRAPVFCGCALVLVLSGCALPYERDYLGSWYTSSDPRQRLEIVASSDAFVVGRSIEGGDDKIARQAPARLQDGRLVINQSEVASIDKKTGQLMLNGRKYVKQ